MVPPYLSIIFTFASPWVLCSAHDGWSCSISQNILPEFICPSMFSTLCMVYDCILIYIFFQEKPVFISVECLHCLLPYYLKNQPLSSAKLWQKLLQWLPSRIYIFLMQTCS